jgi:hypothetical protein
VCSGVVATTLAGEVSAGGLRRMRQSVGWLVEVIELDGRRKLLMLRLLIDLATMSIIILLILGNLGSLVV